MRDVIKAPNSKLQAPENSQISSTKGRCDFWRFTFGASLELGCWSLELAAGLSPSARLGMTSRLDDDRILDLVEFRPPHRGRRAAARDQGPRVQSRRAPA